MTEYKLDNVIKNDRVIARIYRPVLTEEERKRRQKQLYDATVEYCKAVLDARAKKNETDQ